MSQPNFSSNFSTSSSSSQQKTSSQGKEWNPVNNKYIDLERSAQSSELSMKRNLFYHFFFNEPHLQHTFLALCLSQNEFDNEKEHVSAATGAERSLLSFGGPSYSSMAASSKMSSSSSASMIAPVSASFSTPRTQFGYTQMREDENLPQSQSTRTCRPACICLRSSSIPIHDELSLRRVIHTVHFLEGMKTATDNFWPLALLGAHVHDWIMSDVSYSPNWIGLLDHQDFLSRQSVWLAVGSFLGVPVACGIINVLRYLPYIDRVVNQEAKDVGRQPLCSLDSWHIDAMKLFWNGQITHEDRRNLFNQLLSRARGLNLLSQLQALSVLADLVDHLLPEDQNKLSSNTDEQEKKDAAYFRETARKVLNDLSQYEVETPVQGEKDKSVIRYWYANYLRWKLGLMTQAEDCGSKSVLLKGMFWLLQLYLFYAKFRYWERVIVDLLVANNTENNSSDQSICENQGKKWVTFSEKGYAECTLCGDWDIYLGDVQSSNGCWEGFLATPKRPNQIVIATKRFIHNPYIKPPSGINFNQQNWTNWNTTEWDNVLTALSNFEYLDLFNLSRSTTSTFTIDDGKMKRLKLFLQVVPTKKIDLKNQKMSLSEWKDFASNFRNTTTEWIDISGTAMDDASASVFAQELPDSSLSEMSVANNQVGDDGMQVLSRLMMNSSLGMLDVSRNHFTAVGCDSLFAAVSQHSLQLLRSTAQDLKMCDMSKVGKALNSLVSMQISNSYLEDPQFLALTPYLPNSTLVTLDISHNGGTDYGMISFVDNFSPNLKSLNLSGDQLSDDVLQSLVLHWPLGLEELDISDNDFNLDVIRSLFHYLPKSKIRVLKVSHIGDEGATALAQAIPQLPFLEVLDLSGCSLTSNGTQVLMEALPSTPVQSLLLSNNNINDAVASVFKEVLPQTNLTTLALDDNYLTGVTLRSISSILNRSQLKVLSARNNAIGDDAGIDMAQHLIAPLSHPESIGDISLSQSAKREIYSIAKPVTKLTQLALTGNQLTATSARALCRVWSVARNAIHDLQLEKNGIEPTSVDLSTCKISAAEPKNSPSNYLQDFNLFSSRERQTSNSFYHFSPQNTFWHRSDVNMFPPKAPSSDLASSSEYLQTSSNSSIPLAIAIIGGVLFFYWLFAPGIRLVESFFRSDSNKDAGVTQPSFI